MAKTENPPANGSAVKTVKIDDSIEDLSIQKRIAEPASSPAITGGFSSLFFGRSINDNDTLISPWWSPYRDNELRIFSKRPGNDILQGAISSMVKKFIAMNWAIEGPQRVINNYQKILSNADFFGGWGQLLSKTIQDYLTQDKGAFWEILGGGDLSGPLLGPVQGIAHLDSAQCQLTGDPEYPVIFNNAKTNKAHALHASRVAHMVDMPSPNENMNNTGFCATSRVLGSTEILLKVNRYKNEKLDDLPEAGLLILNNILPQEWEDAKADYQRERRKQGQQLWANILSFTSLDPAQPASADFTSFADLPESFDELQTTNIYINIVALAFGVDTREFWPMSGGALGTATESEVMHQKARGKGVGDLISAIERAVNWKILPESATFGFEFKDDQEDLLAAEIDQKRTDTIMSMWKPGNDAQGIQTPVSALEIRQMLADNVSYFADEFLTVDITPEGEATDTQIDKMFGPLMKIDRLGKKSRMKKGYTIQKAAFTDAVDMAIGNYQQGAITAETIAEMALRELLEDSYD